MRILILSFFLLSFLNSFAQQKQYQVTCVGFYNFENQFDTVDDPDIKHEEFLPKRKRLWNEELYNDKLGNIAKVVAMLGTSVTPDGPAILGVCEIDQIIISHSLLEDKEDQMKYNKTELFKEPWMIQTGGQYKGYPKRIFSGDAYSGGYSDDLAVLVYLVKEVK